MYEKQTWVTGEVITKEKLNHMEDGISTGGGIYTCSEVPLFDGEVTTVGAPFAGTTIYLQGDLPKSDIHVTFNGKDYTLPYNNNGQFAYYGEAGDEGPIFVNFPLLISLVEGICNVFTENAGTYSLKINEKVQKLELNDIIANMIPEPFVITISRDDNHYKFDKTYNQIADALNKKQNIIIDFFGRREYIESTSLGSSNYDVYAIAIDHPNLSFKLKKYRATDADGFPIFIEAI